MKKHQGKNAKEKREWLQGEGCQGKRTNEKREKSVKEKGKKSKRKEKTLKRREKAPMALKALKAPRSLNKRVPQWAPLKKSCYIYSFNNIFKRVRDK